METISGEADLKYCEQGMQRKDTDVKKVSQFAQCLGGKSERYCGSEDPARLVMLSLSTTWIPNSEKLRREGELVLPWVEGSSGDSVLFGGSNHNI